MTCGRTDSFTDLNHNRRIAGRTALQETPLPGRHGFTGRNQVRAGQVDLTVKNMLTWLTRHGLTARLECYVQCRGSEQWGCCNKLALEYYRHVKLNFIIIAPSVSCESPSHCKLQLYWASDTRIIRRWPESESGNFV